jgi:hypothetical protein
MAPKKAAPSIPAWAPPVVSSAPQTPVSSPVAPAVPEAAPTPAQTPVAPASSGEPSFTDLFKNHLEHAHKVDTKTKQLFDAKGKRLVDIAVQNVHFPEKLAKTLFEDEEDVFGGNDNNKRVHERAEADRKLVAGEITQNQHEDIHAQLAKEVRMKLRAEAGVDDTTPPWKPNA